MADTEHMDEDKRCTLFDKAQRFAKRGEAQDFLTAAKTFAGAECLIWPFGRNGYGYPNIKLDGKTLGVHRLVCEAAHGIAPSGHDAAHSCGNGHLGCVNPNHLRWATRKENMSDAVAHGTSNRGTSNGHSKLNEAAVRQIRAMRGAGKKQREIAVAMGISTSGVRNVLRGTRWGWVS